MDEVLANIFLQQKIAAQFQVYSKVPEVHSSQVFLIPMFLKIFSIVF